MSNDNQNRKAIARLCLCSTAYLGLSALSALLPGAIAVLGGSSLGLLGVILGATQGVVAGNLANSIDTVDSLEPDRLSLANEDLARAVGRAIAEIIREVAEDKSNGYDRRTRRDLGKIADGAEENWVTIARRETSEERYRELMERNLDELLTAEGKSFAKETAMTPEAWGHVFAPLNMAAHKKSQFQFDPSVCETIAQQLHTRFPKALREALKEDFKKDGKAFAGLTLSLLTNIQEQIKQQGERSTVNFEEIRQQLQEIITRLQPAAEPLTRDRWRELCGQMLEQRKLTTNVFTNNAGVSPIINDVYVPLALVERREKRPQVKAESPERKETEEQLVAVSEDEFLGEVLQQGQSKSGGKRIAVVGEPGSGKTTRLQFIADWILREDLGLPVWVSLADLEGKNISSYLESAWLPMLPGVEISLKELKQQAQEVWLLLDGADEMTARIESLHVEKLLRGWVGEARVIVSCRTNVWEADRNAFSGFDVFRNLEFEPPQVEDYIRKWFGAMEKPSVGEELLEQLAQTPNQRLRDLIGNPLRLWMLCQIWQPEVGLPQTQAQLYGEFVDWVYHWRVDEEIADRREEIDGALAELALAAMGEREESSRLRLPEKWVREQLQERWIFEAVKRLGWLNVVSREGREGVYGFYHLTFLEYFAALAVPGWQFFLSHVPGKPERGVYRIFAPEWKQVILLWLGRDDVDVGEKEEFVRALVEFEDGCGDLYAYRAYFLAAAGISEFQECSFAQKREFREEIVAQIVQWGFGHFHKEKQKWLTYIYPIQEGAREALKEMIRDSSVAALVNILGTSTDEETCMEAADNLEKIAPKNQLAIVGLLELLTCGTDQNIPSRAAECLKTILLEDEKAIATLVDLLATSTDEYIRCQGTEILQKIASSKEEKIVALVELLETTVDKFIHWQVAQILGQISSSKEKAIATIEEALPKIADDETLMLVAKSLSKIVPGNQKAIAALEDLLTSSTNEYTHLQAVWFLEEIAPGNEKAITALEELLATSTDESILWQAAYNLGQIAPGNEKAIATLVKLLASTTDEICGHIAECLGKIAPLEHEGAIATLEQLMETTTDEYIYWQAAESLGRIAPGHKKAIAVVDELLGRINDDLTGWQAAKCLGGIVPGSQKAIAALAEVLATSSDEQTRREAANSLQNILKTNEQYSQVVSKLNHHLSDETYQTNFNLFDECYSLIWHCAQNLPYPEFYRGWHGHNPDDGNPTPQTFHPQQLNRALHQRQLGHTVQPYYIDGSQFLDPDNPAPEIYDQMLDQNSPQRSQGEPANMQQFKTYWKQQRRQGKPILILYEDPQPPAPQGFSEKLLAALSRCGGSICVLKEGEAPPGLPTFSPADPDLIEKMVEWMESINN